MGREKGNMNTNINIHSHTIQNSTTQNGQDGTTAVLFSAANEKVEVCRAPRFFSVKCVDWTGLLYLYFACVQSSEKVYGIGIVRFSVLFDFPPFGRWRHGCLRMSDCYSIKNSHLKQRESCIHHMWFISYGHSSDNGETPPERQPSRYSKVLRWGSFATRSWLLHGCIFITWKTMHTTYPQHTVVVFALLVMCVSYLCRMYVSIDVGASTADLLLWRGRWPCTNCRL